MMIHITLTFFNNAYPWKGGVMWKDIVLMQCRHIYEFQMYIKMQHSILNISNNEENVINPANPLSLYSTPVGSWGVDNKDRRLAELIKFYSLLLLLLNTLCYILFHIWSR